MNTQLINLKPMEKTTAQKKQEARELAKSRKSPARYVPAKPNPQHEYTKKWNT